MDRTWTVEAGGKKHLVELLYPADPEVNEWTGASSEGKSGKLVIDGNEVQTWKTTAEFSKQEISFEIEGKPCVLRKKGLFASKLELFLEGKLIKSA